MVFQNLAPYLSSNCLRFCTSWLCNSSILLSSSWRLIKSVKEDSKNPSQTPLSYRFLTITVLEPQHTRMRQESLTLLQQSLHSFATTMPGYRSSSYTTNCLQWALGSLPSYPAMGAEGSCPAMPVCDGYLAAWASLGARGELPPFPSPASLEPPWCCGPLAPAAASPSLWEPSSAWHIHTQSCQAVQTEAAARAPCRQGTAPQCFSKARGSQENTLPQ